MKPGATTFICPQCQRETTYPLPADPREDRTLLATTAASLLLGWGALPMSMGTGTPENAVRQARAILAEIDDPTALARHDAEQRDRGQQ